MANLGSPAQSKGLETAPHRRIPRLLPKEGEKCLGICSKKKQRQHKPGACVEIAWLCEKFIHMQTSGLGQFMLAPLR